MKKVCLLFLVAVFSLATYAQKGAKYKVTLAPQHSKTLSVNEPAPSDITKSAVTSPVVKPKGIPSKNAKDVEVIELGSSSNAFSIIAGHKNQLHWEPAINTYVFIHRGGGPLTNGETGNDVTFDFSTDGGATWLVNRNPGPYMHPGGGLQVSRYPSGNLYNPAGNTDPNNAFCISAGIVHSGGWESAEYQGGAIKLDGTNQHDTVVNCGVLGRGMDIPGVVISTKTGTVWCVERGVNAVGGAGRTYIDTIYFMKGNMNPGTQKFQWEMLFLEQPSLLYSDGTKSNVGSPSIGFQDNGLDGILAFSGFMDTNQYKPQNSTIWFMKTNDGGQTWNDLTGCNFVDIPEIRNFIDSMDVVDLFNGAPVPPRSEWFYLPWGETNMVLDQYGNPHFNVLIALGSIVDGTIGDYGFGNTPEFRGMFHIWYDMACGEWFAHVIGRPHTVNGTYAGMNEEANRQYIMRSYEGDKIFLSYSETDTVAHAGSDNTQPDIKLVGFDAVTRTHTPHMNMTVGTDAEGVAHMATATHYVRTASATEWEIPYVYGSWNQTNQNDLLHFLIKGFMVTESDFAIANAVTAGTHTATAPTVWQGNDGSLTVTVSCAVPVTSATICGVAGKAAPQAGKADYTFVFNGLAAGDYDVYFQNADGDFMMDTYTVPVSIAERSNLSANLNVAPNPAKDQLNVNFNIEGSQNVTVKLVSINGQVAFAETFNANGNVNRTIDVSNYAQGIYFVQVVTANGVATQKVAIR